MVFRRIGNGPPLLLLHGGHGSWLHWVRNVDALSARHTLWLADMPGYGDSGVPEGAQTLENIVGVLGRAVDQLLGESTALDIAGFSFGGLCAATLAAARPQVRRVALLGPGGHGLPRRERLGMLNWKDLPPGPERDARLHHNLAALMLHEPAHIDAMALALHRSACVNTRWRSKGLSRRALLPDALEILSQRQVPVLLAWGEHDVTAVPTQAGPALLAGASQMELVIVPNAGHWLQYEAADATDRLLLDWFAPA
ncbi:alpha/beta fold hydrolase [Xylophilus rhododendri]|uniref:Alpha/beta fold hydrolase n=1 Tax=Xylophilus rhododendri TaxID=2697032 RepID=A0A857JEC8_9BURK|nr:alpha/beta fold hydrolase [Xylophilus rhododendri]